MACFAAGKRLPMQQPPARAILASLASGWNEVLGVRGVLAALLARPGLVDYQRPAIHRVAIEQLDGPLQF